MAMVPVELFCHCRPENLPLRQEGLMYVEAFTAAFQMDYKVSTDLHLGFFLSTFLLLPSTSSQKLFYQFNSAKWSSTAQLPFRFFQ